MGFNVEFGNILDYSADAIVMPANPKPIVGNGLDKLIYHKAGRNRLLKVRREIGEIEFGEAVITDAFDLRKKGFYQIIHTASPAYDGGEGKADELLKKCYQSSLKLAVDNRCNSVVFPLLSSGVLKYPMEKARSIAEAECNHFVADHDISITLVIYDGSKTITDYDEAELATYINENSYSNLSEASYLEAERNWGKLPKEREEWMILSLMRKKIERKRKDEREYQKFIQKENVRKKTNHNTFKEMTFFMNFTHHSLDDYINGGSRPTFDDVFEKFRRQNNAGSDADICKKGNLRKDTLSKIRGRKQFSVNRDYLWALAVALKINLEETEELFNSCGLSIRGGYNFNIVEEWRERALEYFVDHKWSIHDINIELYNRGMALLGNDNDRVA